MLTPSDLQRAQKPRQRPAPKLSERGWQRTVVEAAQWHGWRVAHFRPAFDRGKFRTPIAADGKGFPDLVMARAGTVLFVELKRDAGKLTPEQMAWGLSLGDGFLVWRPADWPAVQKRLARVRIEITVTEANERAK